MNSEVCLTILKTFHASVYSLKGHIKDSTMNRGVKKSLNWLMQLSDNRTVNARTTPKVNIKDSDKNITDSDRGANKNLTSGRCNKPDESGIKIQVKYPHEKLDPRHVIDAKRSFDQLPMQGLFVPFPRVGSDDPVRVLCLFHNKYIGYS